MRIGGGGIGGGGIGGGGEGGGGGMENTGEYITFVMVVSRRNLNRAAQDHQSSHYSTQSPAESHCVCTNMLYTTDIQ